MRNHSKEIKSFIINPSYDAYISIKDELRQEYKTAIEAVKQELDKNLDDDTIFISRLEEVDKCRAAYKSFCNIAKDLEINNEIKLSA